MLGIGRGETDTDGVGRLRRIPRHSHHPQATPTCTHPVDAGPTCPPLRCHPVSQTPIYDQLRGERINADVPAPGAGPQRVGYTGQHRRLDGAAGTGTVFGRPLGAGAELAANQRHPAVVEAAARGSQVTPPPAAHARPEQAQPGSGPPVPEVGDSSPAQYAAVDGRGAHLRERDRPQQGDHTEPPFAVPVGGQ